MARLLRHRRTIGTETDLPGAFKEHREAGPSPAVAARQEVSGLAGIDCGGNLSHNLQGIVTDPN